MLTDLASEGKRKGCTFPTWINYRKEGLLDKNSSFLLVRLFLVHIEPVDALHHVI